MKKTLLALAAAALLSIPASAQDYTGSCNTYLSPDQYQQYQVWLDQCSRYRGYDCRRDLRYYDLQGAWLHGCSPASGYWPNYCYKPTIMLQVNPYATVVIPIRMHNHTYYHHYYHHGRW